MIRKTLSAVPKSLHRRVVIAQPPISQFSTTSPVATKDNPFVIKSKHEDIKSKEAKRPPFDRESPITVSQVPNPSWKFGEGANDKSTLSKQHVEIDPFEEGRTMLSNYKLLVSGIPRPISFLSTVSKDRQKNLAPFSYFQVVDHDPPIFVVRFSARSRSERPKDTLKNLEETGECVINIVSEHTIEAVNATSIDVPYGVSEWDLSGLTETASTTVKPARVKEAVFAIEGKLREIVELDYHGEGKVGKPTGALAIIEASRFWVREDAINQERSEIDLETLRPLTQLGGISYGRVKEIFELPRPSIASEMEKEGSNLKSFLEKARKTPETTVK
jgi:flavin reductase (DIM6/NTAB) family NADH-FMN oxidoreductase RutF